MRQSAAHSRSLAGSRAWQPTYRHDAALPLHPTTGQTDRPAGRGFPIRRNAHAGDSSETMESPQPTKSAQLVHSNNTSVSGKPALDTLQ